MHHNEVAVLLQVRLQEFSCPNTDHSSYSLLIYTVGLQ